MTRPYITFGSEYQVPSTVDTFTRPRTSTQYWVQLNDSRQVKFVQFRVFASIVTG